MMAPKLETAITTVQAAGDMLRQQFGTVHQIRHKGATDLVTEMDCEVENLITGILRNAFPTYGLLGEEQGQQCGRDNPRWLIDPLD